jgi:hypothetical protein
VAKISKATKVKARAPKGGAAPTRARKVGPTAKRVPAVTEKLASPMQKPTAASAGAKTQSRGAVGGEGSPTPAESKPIGRRNDGDHTSGVEATTARASAEAHPIGMAGGPGATGGVGSASKTADDAHPGLPIPIASFTI